MTIDCVSKVFYEPNALMVPVLAVLNVTSAANIHDMSAQEKEILATAVHKVEVIPTHRNDRKRAIVGVSELGAGQLMVSIKGDTMSVAEYLNKRYRTKLRFP